jgi:N-acyl homoserine lactone hydrolase
MSSLPDPIERVSVISTGSVYVRPEHIGPTWKPMPLWLFTSRQWTGPRPINVFVVEHRDGLLLFDTGQDRASVTDPSYFPGRMDRVVNARLAKAEIGPADTLEARLTSVGYGLDDVATVVLSHLHPDHIGGLPLLGHTKILVSSDEWDVLNGPRPQARGIYRTHIDLPGLRWNRITPEPLGDPALAPFTAGYDVFADGTVVLLPTPGHSPGSLSMLVRRPGKAPLLMVGDLTYDADLMADGHVSGMCDEKPTRAAMKQIEALRERTPDLVVLPSHDPKTAERLAVAHPD